MLQTAQKKLINHDQRFHNDLQIKLLIEEFGIEDFVNLIKSDIPFSFARYGNGEWDCILGNQTGTGSGSQVFTDDLREAMRETIHKNIGVMFGIQNTIYLKKTKLLRQIFNYLKKNEIQIDWYAADVFHYASKNKELGPLVNVLRDKNFVMVGPKWLNKLDFVDDVIVVKEKNCWDNVDVIEKELSDYDGVIGFAAGPTSNVLIHRLHGTNQLIDFGSVFDVYCGVKSRKYHTDITSEHFEANNV